MAEGRGKAQAASLKKTQKDTEARLIHEDGTEEIVSSSQLKKGDIVLVKAGEIIPNDGEVIEGVASVDELRYYLGNPLRLFVKAVETFALLLVAPLW